VSRGGLMANKALWGRRRNRSGGSAGQNNAQGKSTNGDFHREYLKSKVLGKEKQYSA
jgi:hypothetical protein